MPRKKPSPVELPDPNWDEIRSLARESEKIYEAGKMDRETWRRLWAEAVDASNGFVDGPRFLFRYAEAAWIHEMFDPPATRSRRRSVA